MSRPHYRDSSVGLSSGASGTQTLGLGLTHPDESAQCVVEATVGVRCWCGHLRL